MSSPKVDIQFDCVPLRTLGSTAIPDDASPKFRALVTRILQARDAHGSLNSYYLHRAHCCFFFTNDPQIGSVRFTFEGTVLTDSEDRKTRHCHLQIHLEQETCPWLNEGIVTWLAESVHQAVRVEFDRYIAAGDLSRAEERLKEIQKQSDALGGFLGMHL
jgi:hypothetical protein